MALQNQLETLEERLAQLLIVLKNMAQENEQLRARQQHLQSECDGLQQKNMLATRQIEDILDRLRQHNGAAQE